jgi:FkbM family methyltransferase
MHSDRNQEVRSVSLSLPAPALSEEQPIAMTVRCRDADSIPKVPEAGKVWVDPDGIRIQVMHNGLKMLADGYYGWWITKLIEQCRGHHKPQEERIFHEVVKHLRPKGAMLELGGFFAYYSLWFLQGAPERRAIIVEPDPAHLAVGQTNAALNHLTPEFVAGSVGRNPATPSWFQTRDSGPVLIPRMSVPQLFDQCGIDELDVLHCNVHGAETDVIESCVELLRQERIRWIFVSTHAYQITGDPLTHQRCLALLRHAGAFIEGEYDINEAFSGDGLIVARFGSAPPGWIPVELSRNRYSESLFRNPIYDLAEKLGGLGLQDAERYVRTLYETILLRAPDPDGLKGYSDMLYRTGDLKSLIETILRSDEFASRHEEFLGCYVHECSRRARPALIRSGIQFTLARDGPLGNAGETLLIPEDRVMMPFIAANGFWELEGIEFAADKMDLSDKYVLLDIGANVGFFSRQFLHRFPCVESCICIEPDPGNFSALSFNMAKFERSTVRSYNVALGVLDSAAEFYRDRQNIGNYSLNIDAMRNQPFEQTTVTVAATERWMREMLPGSMAIIWKSDTQGFDETIISLAPWEVWNRVRYAIIELSRINKPMFDIAEFRRKIDSFPNKSIGLSRRPASIDEIVDYLSGNDGSHEDLYLWR